MALKSLAILVLLGAVAHAQPAPLRDANAAAGVGDWARVGELVQPLLRAQLPRADRAEAHRLAGLAAYFQQQPVVADTQFFEYLKLDLDGRLDPALYPPDVVAFFEGVRIKYGAELRKLRPKTPRRYKILNLLPPIGQFQNGQKTKAWILTGTIGGLAIANGVSFFVLRSWCKRVIGDEGGSVVCDGRESSASKVRAVNIASGVGLIVAYVYGVYDGVTNFRRRDERVQPFVSATGESALIGVSGRF